MTTNSDGGSDDLLARVLELARQAVRGVPLLKGYADDLAQEAQVEFLSRGLRRPRDKEIADTVRRLAERERQRRRKEAQRAAAAKTRDAPRRSVPPLLPRLAGLAPFAPDVGRFERVLRSAMHTVATDPGVLLDYQLRLFELAYVEGRCLAKLTAMLRVPSEEATQRRLRRISQRIETELLARVRPVLSGPSWALVFNLANPNRSRAGPPQERISNDVREALKGACADFVAAVEAVIHRDPDHPVS